MPLAREQRNTLARVLRWSRSNGWIHDAYPYTWRSTDRQAHVRYDAIEHVLVVDHTIDDPLRYQTAFVPVESPEVAVDVLAALGCIPFELSPMAQALLGEQSDDHDWVIYRRLMLDGRHRYMSTYCQHGQHEACRRECKCCGAPCVCVLCLHTAGLAVDSPPAADYQPRHTADEQACLDGPADFAEAGREFADAVDGRVSAELAAEVLSRLAGAGLLVSLAYHEETRRAGDEAQLIVDMADMLGGDR